MLHTIVRTLGLSLYWFTVLSTLGRVAVVLAHLC
jgi:hypothetical protein